MIQHVLPTLQVFQTVVAKNQQKFDDIQLLAELLAAKELAALISPDMARVLLAEAVDCHARSKSIAHHWFCSARLISGAVVGSLTLQKL